MLNAMVDELGMRRPRLPRLLRLLAVPVGVALVSACQFPGYSFEHGGSDLAGVGGAASASSGGSSGSGSTSGAGSQSTDGGSKSSGGEGGVFGNGGDTGETDDGEGGIAGESATGGAGDEGGSAGAGGSAGGAFGCTGAEDFCDDFEDLIADGWSTSGGTWVVMDEDGNDVFEGGGASEEALAGDPSWADQIVEARVRVVSFGGDSDTYRAGVVARYASSSAYYVFALGGDRSLTIRRSTGAPSGSSGTCAPVSTSIDPSEWFTLKLQVTGPSGNVRLRTYLNGTPIHDCTTTATTTGSGKVGVLTVGSGTTARFDDVKVLLP